MSEIKKTVDSVKAFMREQHLTAYAMAKLAGLSKNALRDWQKKDWSPAIKTLEKLEAVMAGRVVKTSSKGAKK